MLPNGHHDMKMRTGTKSFKTSRLLIPVEHWEHFLYKFPKRAKRDIEEVQCRGKCSPIVLGLSSCPPLEFG